IQDVTNNKQPFVIEGNSVNNAFYINAAGKLGLGTFLPLNKLDVLGAAAFGSYAAVNAAPANGLIVSGSVGIGTASPTQALEVAANIKSGGTFIGDGSTLTNLNAGNVGAGTLAVARGGTGVTAAQGNGTKVQLSTGATTANDCVKFDANGNTVDAGAACG